MVLFDANGCLKKYDTVEEILRDFYTVRLRFYEKRKNYLEGVLQAESRKLTNQARFICEKCDGVLIVENKKVDYCFIICYYYFIELESTTTLILNSSRV